MNDYNRLNHSESLTELPDTLITQIEAIEDFDPFAPINNSFTKATSSYMDPTSLAIPETVEKPQFKAMQKLGIFGDSKLTEIIEEYSEMEVSEFSDRSQMPSLTHLKHFDFIFRLEDLGPEPNEYDESSKDRAKTDRDYGESDKRQHQYKNHQQSNYGDRPRISGPDVDVDIDINYIKDFNIGQQLQHVGKIEILNNNNYFINVNGKEKLVDFLEETTFKKKQKPEKHKNNKRGSINTNNSIKNIIEKSQNDTSVNSIMHIMSNVTAKRTILAYSNNKSNTKDADKDQSYKTLVTNNHTKSHFMTPKQIKSEIKEGNKDIENIKNSQVDDIYRNHRPKNSTLNTYKKRYGSIDHQKFINSIDSLTKKISEQRNVSLSRLEISKNEVRTSAFRELFGNDDGYKTLHGISKPKRSYQPFDKDIKIDQMTKSDIHTRSITKFKRSAMDTSKDDRLSIQSVIHPIEKIQPRASMHVMSTFKKKHTEAIKRFDEAVDFYSSIDNLKHTVGERGKKSINGIISNLNLENNIYSKMNKVSTIGPTTDYRIFSDNLIDKTIDMTKSHKGVTYDGNRTILSSNVMKKNKKDNKQRDISENKRKFIEFEGKHNEGPIFSLLKQNFNESDIQTNDSSLSSVQFETNTCQKSCIDNSDISFKSIQFKAGTQQKNKNHEHKKVAHDSKTTVNFVEKNKSIIEKGKDSNYDLLKVCQTNQRFFDKIKMMSKI